MQQKPHTVSEESCTRSSVGGQIAFQKLDEVLCIASGAIEFGVNRVGVGQVH